MEVKLFRLPPERFPELNRLFDMSFMPEFERERRENIAIGKEICVVAECNGSLIGEVSAVMTNNAIPEATLPNRRAYLFALRVDEDFRGEGIGSELIRTAAELLRQRGYHELTVGVEDENPRARRLYERLGFTERLARCSESFDGRSYEFDLLIRRSAE